MALGGVSACRQIHRHSCFQVPGLQKVPARVCVYVCHMYAFCHTFMAGCFRVVFFYYCLGVSALMPNVASLVVLLAI